MPGPSGSRSGVDTYVAYRRHRGCPDEDHKVVLPKPAVEHEVEYESVLVAFEDGHYSSEAVSTAAQLAARRRRGIHVLVTITVPPNVPIDADTPEQEARANKHHRLRARGRRTASVRPLGEGPSRAGRAGGSWRRPRRSAPARS